MYNKPTTKFDIPDIEDIDMRKNFYVASVLHLIPFVKKQQFLQRKKD